MWKAGGVYVKTRTPTLGVGEQRKRLSLCLPLSLPPSLPLLSLSLSLSLSRVEPLPRAPTVTLGSAHYRQGRVQVVIEFHEDKVH